MRGKFKGNVCFCPSKQGEVSLLDIMLVQNNLHRFEKIGSLHFALVCSLLL